jgi:sialidase-1
MQRCVPHFLWIGLLCLGSSCEEDFTQRRSDTTQGGEPVKRVVFEGGERGYHTYRIPALVRSMQGTLLAFCEGRKNNILDHGDIDLVLRRSHDNGETWGPLQIVCDEGRNTIGNPSPVVDRSTGTVWLLFCRNNLNVLVTRSDDDGSTWAEPQDITRYVKPFTWAWYATGPGHGIQLSSGRLLVPCDHSEGLSMYSHVIYSDDHGMSWMLGGSADPKTDESMAVERTDGSVYLTMRNSLFKKMRAFTVSSDGGQTWQPVKPAPELIDPVCQASILRLAMQPHLGRDRICFLNPADELRRKLTIRVSYDDCNTWSVSRLLEEGPSGYSDMTLLADGRIGALYETGLLVYHERIVFRRLSTEWIERSGLSAE